MRCYKMEKENKVLLEKIIEENNVELKEEKERNKRIERVLKEKGIDGLTKSDRALVKSFLNHEPTTFDKELYKKLTHTEKFIVYYKDGRVNVSYDHYVKSIRYSLRGEVFNPYEEISQDFIQEISDGTDFRKGLESLLELEYLLKQKYNKEDDK